MIDFGQFRVSCSLSSNKTEASSLSKPPVTPPADSKGGSAKAEGLASSSNQPSGEYNTTPNSANFGLMQHALVAEDIVKQIAITHHLIRCLERSMQRALVIALVARENHDEARAREYQAAVIWYAYSLSATASSIPHLIQVMDSVQSCTLPMAAVRSENLRGPIFDRDLR